MGYLSVRPLAVFAAISGILQGILWTLGSITGILFYHDVLLPTASPKYEQNLGRIIYELYLNDEFTPPENELIIYGNVFYAFLWPYLIVSFILLAFSCTLLWSLIHEKVRIMKIFLLAWSTLILVTSIMDLALTTLIGIDYEYWTSVPSNEGIIITATGIVMSLTARGFILLLINIILAIVLLIQAIKIKKSDYTSTHNNFISAYDTRVGPAEDFLHSDMLVSAENMKGFDNQGYVPENDGISQINHSLFDNDPHSNDSCARSPTNYQNFDPYDSMLQTPINCIDTRPLQNSSSYPNIHQNNNNHVEQNIYSTMPNLNMNNKPHNPLANPPVNQQPKTATIGKSKGRTLVPIASPQIPRHNDKSNINKDGVYIPPPDYTPPNSPKMLKSALKQKSLYDITPNDMY